MTSSCPAAGGRLAASAAPAGRRTAPPRHISATIWCRVGGRAPWPQSRRPGAPSTFPIRPSRWSCRRPRRKVTCSPNSPGLPRHGWRARDGAAESVAHPTVAVDRITAPGGKIRDRSQPAHGASRRRRVGAAAQVDLALLQQLEAVRGADGRNSTCRLGSFGSALTASATRSHSAIEEAGRLARRQHRRRARCPRKPGWAPLERARSSRQQPT